MRQQRDIQKKTKTDSNITCMRQRNPNHYAISMSDFNVQLWKVANRMETIRSRFWLELKNERCDSRTDSVKKVQNHVWLVSIESREKTVQAEKKNKIGYILTNRPDIVTYLTVTNQVYIERNYKMVMRISNWT